MDLQICDEKPGDLRLSLSKLYKQIVDKIREKSSLARVQYDKTVREMRFIVGYRVRLRPHKLNNERGRKNVRLWLEPYKIVKWLGRVGHELQSQFGNKIIRAHANRMRRTGSDTVEIGNSENGVFPNNLRILNATVQYA